MTRSGIEAGVLAALRTGMRGEVLTSVDPGYDDAREIWNGRFDRHPAAIARCTSVADVVAAVDIAREHGLVIAVRSGGHDYAGNAVCDGGLVIDLSLMNGVEVDAPGKRVRLGPGARWGEVDRATQTFGLATTGGTVSTVGVTGFTLGGGTGHLVRKHGLALDNLISAEIVTADGAILRASDDENRDLFWALRGGSGNFGIVTSLDLRLHEVGPEVLAGQLIYPFTGAREALRVYRELMAGAPDELQCYAFFLRLPPLDFIPAEFHGKVVLDLVAAWAGDLAAGEKVLAPLRSFGTPIIDGINRQNYVDLQQSFDAGMPPGNRWYSKAHYLTTLSDEVIDTILRHVENLPGPFTMAYLEAEGGAIARVDPEATAFPHRSAPFALHIFPGWTDEAEDIAMMAWAGRFYADTRAHSTGGVYVNLLGGDEPDAGRIAYGPNYARLAELKRRYDPENLFRLNHNVDPA